MKRPDYSPSKSVDEFSDQQEDYIDYLEDMVHDMILDLEDVMGTADILFRNATGARDYWRAEYEKTRS